jgi:hypothetical protein
MKTLSFIVLMAMALTMVSCGNKNSSGGDSNNVKNSYGVQNITGYIDTTNPYYFVVKENDQYQIIDTSQAMKNAYAQAQSNGVIVQGITRYRVQIAGVFSQSGIVQNQQYPQQQYPQQNVSGRNVQVSSAVWSRIK